MAVEAERNSVESKLRRAWGRERSYYHTRGLCHALVWLVALILVDFAIDWLLEVPGYARVLLLLVNIGTLGWVVYHYWIRFLKPYDRTRVALEVERRHPELESLLVSYVQMGAGTSAMDASPSLVRAMERQALEVTAPLDFRDIINFGTLKRVFVVSALVFVFFCGLSVKWSDYFQILAQRLFNPGSEAKYPTRTRIESATGNIVIRQGDTAALTVKVDGSGLVPTQGTIYYQAKAATDWKKLPVVINDKDELSYSFANVFEGFTYYVRVGDAKTAKFSVSVVPPPRVTEAQLQLHFPAYTAMKEKSVGNLSPDVLEGTEVTWQLRVDPAVSKAEMLLEGGAVMPLVLTENGHLVTYKTTAKASFNYQFRWTEDVHGYSYDEGVQHFVRVVPDVAPEVDIIQPLGDEKATVNKKVTVSFRAVDDFSVVKAWLVYSINEGEEKKVPIQSFSGKQLEALTWRLKESIQSLKENDVIAYAVEVQDNYDGKDGPHTSRSQTRRVTILSLAEYEKYVYETLANLSGEIKKSKDAEVEASEQVKVLKVGE